ncbi:SCP-like extracellular [Methanosalsum zhilinae DSM 4017]|uniref:SCP-like extracellular n=1 Tax=Methanosalsum zhilinae (strain DSM 4017 / NBRC 107636 / OCM 62 / WeN5) TaxID=679901 RepID=F7XLS9_METZD|nr:CAP domain-containing protein [Methanosalsum zhilinae]AEH61006.1 SCP-like extracellular [Methanosalsum zhilinae DSM 4017]
MNMLKGLLILVLAVFMLTPAVSQENLYSFEQQQMLDLINSERAENGLDPLVFNPLLNEVATEHSKEMIEKNYFSHSSFNGDSFWKRLQNAGYSTNKCAENIAMRMPPNVDKAHQSLMASSGHRKNILNPDFNEVGIGIWVGDFLHNGKLYKNTAMYTQNFGWNSSIQNNSKISIESFSPDKEIDSIQGVSKIFSIATDEKCDVTWTVNGNIKKQEYNVKNSIYEENNLLEGVYTVEVTVRNENGIDSKKWKWTIVPEKEKIFDPMKYDINSNGIIDRNEVIMAINDYYSGNITLDDVSEVIDLYFRS